jgi:hypothetical protein
LHCRGAGATAALPTVEYLVVPFDRARDTRPAIVLPDRNHSHVEGLRTKDNSGNIRHSSGASLIDLRYCSGGEGSDLEGQVSV